MRRLVQARRLLGYTLLGVALYFGCATSTELEPEDVAMAAPSGGATSGLAGGSSPISAPTVSPPTAPQPATPPATVGTSNLAGTGSVGAASGGSTVSNPSTGGISTTGTGLTPIAPPTCDDGEKNGTERGIDCGGVCDEQACPLGSDCASEGDCSEGGCVEGTCSTCGNQQLDGDETDVDCGGSCAPCRLGQLCVEGNDCVTRNCDAAFAGCEGVSCCGETNSCLIPLPEGCECDPVNATSVADCEMILDCYIENECDPTTCSTSNDDLCGVNTLGTHGEPMDAATEAYACACG